MVTMILLLSKRIRAAWVLPGIIWERGGETPFPRRMLHHSHGCASPWSFVQSVSSPPFPLPLLYLYRQETSFHLGLLCFVR